MEKNEKVKRYFWFQHSNHFLSDPDRLVMRSQEDGFKVIYFYQWLLEQSLDKEGHLYFKPGIPYSEKLLSRILGNEFPESFIKSSIELFVELDLVEFLKDGTIFMKESIGIIGTLTEQQLKRSMYYQTHKEKKTQSALLLDEKDKNHKTESTFLLQLIDNTFSFDTNQRVMSESERLSLGDYLDKMLDEQDFNLMYEVIHQLSMQICRSDTPVRNYFTYMKNAIPPMIQKMRGTSLNN